MFSHACPPLYPVASIVKGVAAHQIKNIWGYGLNQIRPDIISVEPITQQGNPIEIINEFGGMDEFKKAISELQTLLYAEAA